MILQMFTVYDSKAEAYLPPFYLTTKGLAVRSFIETCSDTQHAFNKHPADYTLFHVGEYDDSNCKFAILDTPISLGVALEFIQQQEQDHENTISNISQI